MDEKKKYLCKLPSNGYNAGDIVELTESEVANYNGGEVVPRFVLADEAAATEVPEGSSTSAPVTPEGEYKDDEEEGDKEEEKNEETVPPAAPTVEGGEQSTPADTTTPPAEGVE